MGVDGQEHDKNIGKDKDRDCDTTTIQEGKNKKRTRTLTYTGQGQWMRCMCDLMRKKKNTEKDMKFFKYNKPLYTVSQKILKKNS
jgi:hypothetical protein